MDLNKAPHVKDTEELKAIIKAKNPQSIEELKQIVGEEAHKIPNLTKRVQDMILVRGTIIDMTINIEKIYNEIILLTENPEKIKDFFQRKTDFIKEIMQNLDPNKKNFEDNLFDKMDKIVTIRNLYAHVPSEIFGEELKFDGGDNYYNKKSMDFKGKSIKEINTEFSALCILMQQKLGDCFMLIGKEVENQKSQTD